MKRILKIISEVNEVNFSIILFVTLGNLITGSVEWCRNFNTMGVSTIIEGFLKNISILPQVG